MGFGSSDYMNDEGLLNVTRDDLPARLNVTQTAKVLGFGTHDLPVLVGAGLLTPLGSPAPNAPKFFARVTIAGLAADVAWLNKATKAVGRYWQAKRARCKASSFSTQDNENDD